MVQSRRRKKPGRKAKEIELRPVPLVETWIEPEGFADALDLHLKRHGETTYYLCRALNASGSKVDYSTLRMWRSGDKEPGKRSSLAVLAAIETRYRLPSGYFAEKLGRRTSAVRGHDLPGMTEAQRRRFAWHLPDDFGAGRRASERRSWPGSATS